MRSLSVVLLAILGFVPVMAQAQEESSGDDPSKEDETAVRYDVTSDILAEPGLLSIDTSFGVVNVSEGGRSVTQLTPGVQLSYSITERFDVVGLGNGQYVNNQTLASPGSSGNSTWDGRFGSLALGGRYLAVKESDYPALEASLLLDLVENTADDTVYARSGNVSLRLRKSVDPVVLRLSGIYQRNGKRQRNGLTRDPADSFVVSGTADFFVNNKVAFTSLLQMETFTNDEIEGDPRERERFAVPFGAGVRYSWNKSTQLSFNGQFDPVNDETQWLFRFTYIYGD